MTIIITDISPSLHEDAVRLAEVSGRTFDQVVHDALLWVTCCGAWADETDPSVRLASPRTLWERLDERQEDALPTSLENRLRKKNKKRSRS